MVQQQAVVKLCCGGGEQTTVARAPSWPPQWPPTQPLNEEAMAFDLQEQEQIDELKAFWRKWGTLITGVLVNSCAGHGWGAQGWRWYQHRQAESAAALYGQMEALAAKG